MSTHSIIIVPVEDKWHAIYCHWDGHLNQVGKALVSNFNTQEAAEDLVALGDCSSIAGATNLDEVVAYTRDKGEASEGTDADIYDTLDEAIASNDEPYFYAFIDGEWNAWDHGNMLGIDLDSSWAECHSDRFNPITNE